MSKTDDSSLSKENKLSKKDSRTTTWSIRLSDPWFDLVRKGIKLYEGRRYWFDVPKYKVGDQLIIVRCLETAKALHHQASKTDEKKETFKATIVSVLKYSTFQEALTSSSSPPLSEILPGIQTVAEGILLYQKFVSLPTQERDGVALIQLRV
jgi:ASC-1-like (ASCH) protein